MHPEMMQIIHSLSSEVFAFEICPEELESHEDVRSLAGALTSSASRLIELIGGE
jgi:hypothetical protein